MNKELTTDRVWSVLTTVLDPEFGVNIVDLGLIYDVAIEGTVVKVAMTLTSQACPAGEMLVGGVHAAVNEMPGVEDVRVELVWEPQWTPDMLTDAGREQLNFGR